MTPTAAAPSVRDDPVLAEIVRRIVAAYAPERIYLFGSVARGDAGPDSDYDLMVLVPDDADLDRRRAGRAYRDLWDIGRAADILVWTRSAFDRRAHLTASLPAAIRREGVLLHGG